jgi:hypothetical protein
LAITYTPRWEYRLENVKKINPKDFNSHFELVNAYGEGDPSRVWPAFGHLGGAWEWIIAKKDKGEGPDPQKSFKVRDIEFAPPPKDFGGIPDIFQSDSVLEGKFARKGDLMDSLAEVIYNWFTTLDNPSSITRFGMKILGNQGIILAWSIDKREYSISCAFRPIKYPPTQCKVVQLGFWGYVWEDEDGTRKIVYPPDCPLTPVWKEYQTIDRIREDIKKEDSKIREYIGCCLSKIYEKLKILNNHFKKIEEFEETTKIQIFKRVKLPSRNEIIDW